MDKEKEPRTDDGFSEKKKDLAMDKILPSDQVKPARIATQGVAGGGGNIFDPKKLKNQPRQPR